VSLFVSFTDNEDSNSLQNVGILFHIKVTDRPRGHHCVQFTFLLSWK